MAINKNFVIKNGLEVDTNLILADSQTNKVGIGTTVPQYTLHVNGGIGVTNLYVSGIATITTGIVTNLTSTNLTSTNLNVTGIGTIVTGNITNLTNTNLNVTGIATIATLNATGIGVTNFTVYNNLSVGGISTFTNGPVLIGSGTSTGTASQRLQVTGGTYVSGNLGIGSTNPTSKLNVIGDVRVTGVITATTFSGNVNAGVGTITNLTGTNVSYSGISTLGTVKISSGIVTATSGIVTYYGDGNFLNLTSNPSRGIGIGTTGGVVGYAVTFINFKGAGVSTTQYNSNTGIATIFFEGGGGGGGSISISTTAPLLPGSGDLWYSPDYGRTFIYYDESVVGYGTDAFWVDAAPFNVGIITSLTNVSFSPGSAVSPSMFFVGDQQTGFFSPGAGQFTVVSSGSSILNINPSGIRVTGVATATNFDSLSDENYKENVITVNNALNKVEQLRGVSFDWKGNGGSSYGVIAQELQEVLPELVHGDKPKTVNYNGIIGVLIEAIKELKKEVEELKSLII
jgi:Chaperone of endosialidase